MRNENEWIGRDILYLDKTEEYRVDLYKNSLVPNENLYTGNINLSLIESRFSTYRLIKTVFENEEYKVLNCDNIDWNKFHLKHKDLYFLGKICFLLKEFITTKNFIHPITLYFNPRISKIICHPGIGRLEVYKLLDVKNIPCVFFNTNGVSLEDIGIVNNDNFSIVTLEDIRKKHDYLLGFSMDHGSLIPQIHFVDNSRQSRINYIKKLHQKISNLRIKSNIKIPFIHSFLHDDYNVEFNFKGAYTEIDIARAIILAITEYNYDSDTLQVKIKNG